MKSDSDVKVYQEQMDHPRLIEQLKIQPENSMLSSSHTFSLQKGSDSLVIVKIDELSELRSEDC